VASTTLVYVDAIILWAFTVLLPQLWLVYTVTQLALESTVRRSNISDNLGFAYYVTRAILQKPSGTMAFRNGSRSMPRKITRL
jgi:hypothetical protein